MKLVELLPAPGRTQPTPSTNRSVGAELTGTTIFELGMALTVSYLMDNLDITLRTQFGGKCKEMSFVAQELMALSPPHPDRT